MATNTPRYLVENDGTNDGSLQIALSNGAQICMRTGVTTITLLVPTLKSFAESAMGGFLGAANAKALGTNKPLAISDTLSLQLSSLRTVSRDRNGTHFCIFDIWLPARPDNSGHRHRVSHPSRRFRHAFFRPRSSWRSLILHPGLWRPRETARSLGHKQQE